MLRAAKFEFQIQKLRNLAKFSKFCYDIIIPRGDVTTNTVLHHFFLKALSKRFAVFERNLVVTAFYKMGIILPKIFTGKMQFSVGGLDSFPKSLGGDQL